VKDPVISVEEYDEKGIPKEVVALDKHLPHRLRYMASLENVWIDTLIQAKDEGTVILRQVRKTGELPLCFWTWTASIMYRSRMDH